MAALSFRRQPLLLSLASGSGQDRQRLLFDACRNGDIEQVKALMTTQNVNSRDFLGRKSTPLHFAAGKQRQKRTLAHPSLCTCAGFGRRDIVEHLLETGAKVDIPDEGPRRDSYYEYSVIESIFSLLVLGGLIPLHNASSFGHADVVRILLSRGANPNARDNWSFTPLHEAAIKGKLDVCIGE